MDWIELFVKALFGGIASVGFAVLFVVPLRTIVYIFGIGFSGVFTKFLLMKLDVNIILSSFIGAAVVGTLAQWAARKNKTTPLILSIPSVIPMISGILTYKAMIGLIKLSGDLPQAEYSETLITTLDNGLKGVFIIMALSIGVSIPNLLLRKQTFNDARVFRGLK